MNKPYVIGLDIGTSSVGWAVVNEETNKLVRKGNKNLWGVRLFDDAKTARDRRAKRSNRRRLERRRQRIKLLRDAFELEINKVDADFYKKLDQSFLNPNDSINSKLKLTGEEKKFIVEYNKSYPTIYHLRQRLIKNDAKEDIRLVYLAIHHIIKYRGNFLQEGNSFNAENLNIKDKLRDCFDLINEKCNEFDFNDDYINMIDYEKLEKALLMPLKADKKAYVENELKPYISKDQLNQMTKMFLGNKFSIAKFFGVEIEKDTDLSFSDADFDKKIDEANLDEVKFEVIIMFKELYDMLFLKSLFKDSSITLLSDLMVKKYEEHENDLRYLKDIFNYNRKLYRQMFRTNSSYTCTYDLYIHNKLSYNDFIKELNKYLPNLWSSVNNVNLFEKYETKYLKKIEEGNFLPRITETNNGIFPYQLNELELELIIKNQSKYYPFLGEMVGDKFKLVKLLEFKIPYYIGPLNKNSEFAWLEKNSDGKITPYNFDDVINKDESAVKFIERMLGHCTYLFDEYAMPNNSLICCEYKVLNELKQIRVCEQKLTNEFIRKIIDELFKKYPSVTDKKFKEYIYQSGEFSAYNGNIEVRGYSADKKFANNMCSYIDFFGENGFFKDTKYTSEDAETIIRWITIFEDKNILKNKLINEYPNLSNRVNEIVKKKYSGWSGLSKRFLTEKYYVDKKTGLKKSILDLMWETEENFMQIINNKEYKFDEMINEINNNDLQINNSNIDYLVVDKLAASPSTKRGIWQSILVVKDIVKYMGYEPKHISIEMSRGDDKKERTIDRKNMLSNIYNKIKDQIADYNELKSELDSQEKIDSEKLFLYFIQEGRSLYSRTRLDINKLNEYEVDHILPQSLIKDDSIENKALVLREENQEKAAQLVLPRRYIINNRVWWKELRDKKLISPKKMNNLIRMEYSNEDIEGFINRQLVETRQITKHVANIFGNCYKNTGIIYLPASLSHNYRLKFELFKFRELNDYHHAHDAYLASVLGLYKNKFKTNVNLEKIKELFEKLHSENKFKELKYGYVINSIDNEFAKFNSETGEILFDADNFNKLVSDTLYQNDIIVTRKTEIKTGEFYDQTIYKKGNIKAKYSVKSNFSTKLYGGYNSINPSYMQFISYTVNNKIKKSLIGIPILYDNNSDKETCISNYINNSLKCDNYNLLCNKIPFNSETVFNNHKCYITGCQIGQSELVNAVQLRLTKEEQIKYKYLLNFILNKKYPIKSSDINDSTDYKEYWQCKFNNDINELYNLLIEKIKVNYPLYENIALKLENSKNDFDKLNLINSKNDKQDCSKCDVIKEILIITKCNASNGNLSKFKGKEKFSDRIGRLSGKRIKELQIINNSPSGLWSYKREF